MAKAKYYALDAGFFPQIIYAAFSNDAYKQCLRDHGIHVEVNAFERGMAETHTIESDRGHLVIMVFNLDDYIDNEVELIGTIAHECSHTVERFGKFIGEDNLAGETRAYFLQSLVEQTYEASKIEREQVARKTNRSLLNKKSKGEEWAVSEMDVLCYRSSGPHCDTPKPPRVCRTKNIEGGDIRKAKDSVSATKRLGVPCHSNKIKRGG